MEPGDVLPFTDRSQFRKWLERNHDTESECWLYLKRGRPVDEDHFWYIDAVEEALCFGWIDSQTGRKYGRPVQRFTRRRPGGLFSELNRARVERLERLGLMTDAGRAVVPPRGREDYDDIISELKSRGSWEGFMSFPELYRRIRLYNIDFYRNRDKEAFRRGIDHLAETSKEGKMFGEWNDYGRLL